MDSSAEELGMKDIAGHGFGGVVESERRIVLGRCGMKDRRVVAVEDCRTGGGSSFCDESNVQFGFEYNCRQTSHEQIIDN